MKPSPRNKERLLAAIRYRAEEEAAFLAGEFARAASEEKEAILAALQFEQWLAQACGECSGCRNC